MTQQPFSRPGAIDLSGLRRPAAQPAPALPAAQPRPAGRRTPSTSTEENFQSVIESSMTAPVLLVFYSHTRLPESAQLADDLATLSAEYEGRFLAGLVDIDAVPAIAQAMQIPRSRSSRGPRRPARAARPGRAADRGAAHRAHPAVQQLTVQGVTGRHQPRVRRAGEGDDGEEPARPALRRRPRTRSVSGDIDRAVAEYQKLVTANPADAEAAAGLAMAKVLQRTQGVDLDAARAAAAERPDDVAAQTMVADLDLLGGHVDDAFQRLIDLVRRTSGDERTRRASTCSGSSAPSATTTRGCSRAVRVWPLPSSELAPAAPGRVAGPVTMSPHRIRRSSISPATWSRGRP